MEKEEIIRIAKERLKNEKELDAHNRLAAIDDNEFIYIDDAQWDSKERAERKKFNRPVIQMNLLQKYSNQVTGEMRMNKTKIKVLPASGEASKEIADTQQGMIMDIEQESSAESIYDDAGQGMVDCGYGAARVITQYSDDKPFEQVVRILPIADAVATVYLDTHGQKKFYEDADYGFILQSISKDTFKREFNKTDEELPGYGQQSLIDVDGIWYDEESVSVVEYFWKEYATTHTALLSDGTVMEYAKAEEHVKAIKSNYEAARVGNPEQTDETLIPEIVNDRQIEKVTINWVRMTSDEILEEKTWPGTIIPIVLGHGKVKVINGKRYISGLIRNSKDAQKVYNYWHTTVIETLSASPKNPLVVSAKQIAGFEKDYLDLHNKNFGFIKYNPDKDAPGPPQRLAPSNPSPAIFTELDRAENNIENTIGMHKADVGAMGRELSGSAIEARQMPGHVSTFLYQDNLTKFIGQIGKIIVDVLPAIYDSERDAKVRRDGNQEEYTPINTTVGKAIELAKGDPEKFSGIDVDKLGQKVQGEGGDLNADFNNMSEGKYSAIVSAGPSYETRRQEAAASQLQFAQVSPTMTPTDKYFYLLSADWEGAEDQAAAVRKQIPYGVLKPKPGEQPPPPPKPDPVQMMELEIKKLELQNAVANQKVQEAKMVTESERLKTERVKQVKEIAKIKQDERESGIKIHGEVAKTIKDLNNNA